MKFCIFSRKISSNVW